VMVEAPLAFNEAVIDFLESIGEQTPVAEFPTDAASA